MSNLMSLNDLLVVQLEDILDAEHQLKLALPAMAKAAHDENLREAFASHLDETMQQIDRLRDVFQMINAVPQRRACKAMAGLIVESQEMLHCSSDHDVLDAALISAAQRIEHYEIAAYGSVKAFAKRLGLSDAAGLLDDTLDEELAAEKKLVKLAEGGLLTRSINKDAAAGS